MENAAQALKMAAWVLIFVAALSITMNAFSQARQGIDAVLTYTDREYLTSYIPPSGDTQRVVESESIIPAIYRSFKDNYRIVFLDYVLYTLDGVEINYIDLSINGYTDYEQELFLNAIMYGFSTNDHFKNIKFEFKNKNGQAVSGGLRNLINNHTYKESIGVYYLEDVGTGSSSSVPDANKKEKRIITYVEV